MKAVLLVFFFLAAPLAGQQGLYDYLQTGDAAGLLLEAQERGPAALFLRAYQQLEAGDVAGARAAAGELAGEQGPWAAAGWGLLAECAMRQDSLEAAASCLERLRRQAPQAAYWTRFQQAEMQYLQGRFKEAAPELEALVGQDAAHPRANDALALLLRLEKYRDHTEELQVFARAQLRLRQGRDAGPEWARLEAGKALADLGLLERGRAQVHTDPEAALRCYGQLLDQFPQSHLALDARLEQARTHEFLGEREEALKAYEAALLQFPEDARVPQMRLHIQRLRRLQGSAGG